MTILGQPLYILLTGYRSGLGASDPMHDWTDAASAYADRRAYGHPATLIRLDQDGRWHDVSRAAAESIAEWLTARGDDLPDWLDDDLPDTPAIAAE